MVGKGSLFVTGISAAFLAVVPSASAQQSAPRVRLDALPATAPNTVSPRVSVSDAAYIFAVAIDRDGRASVLSPTLPSDAIRFEPAKSIHLPEFFGGFSSARYAGYGSPNYNSRGSGFIDYDAGTAMRGSVLVIASRTPFNFAAVSDGVYWDEEAIRQIVRYRIPASAVTALGRAVTGKGQSFGHDYMFFGSGANSRFASSAFDGHNTRCIVDYSYSPYGFSNFASYAGVTGLYATGLRASGFVLLNVGTDGCGRPRYIVMPYKQIPPPEPKKPDSVEATPQPQIRSAATGTFSGADARRVFEILQSRNSSESFMGLPRSPILIDKEDGTPGRPVNRDASPDRVESFERIRGANPAPIERAPILRQAEPRQQSTPVIAQPIIRSEPVVRSTPVVQRESKPAEVTSAVKDN